MAGPVERCRSLRCAALLLALIGLFAMHGLGEHGTHDAGVGDHRSMVMGSGHDGHADHAPALAGPAATDGIAPTGPLDGGLPMAVGATCLAVLGLLLLRVLDLVRAARSRRLLTCSSRPPRLPLARGRAPDPPSLHLLSVQRC